ncbi:MAG TPA: RHS repeat-associated core domain-containing protein [Gemmatimonadales bacterium]|nr:RHS repeat-associated core domain-containing protein [Gemmatimonadales bacterium]
MVAQRSWSVASGRLFYAPFVCLSLLGAQSLGAQIPPPIHAVTVTPKGDATVSWSQNTGGHTFTFTVTNGGNNLETYLISCRGTGTVTCASVDQTSVSLQPDASALVTATYSVAGFGTGALKLTASHLASDYGYITVNAVPPSGAPVVDVTPYNYDKQDYSRCANACFAGMTSRATVPYFSLDAPRQVVLVYNGDRLNSHPFVLVNVSPDTTFGSWPTKYQLQVKVNGVFVHFVNGDSVLNFSYDHATMGTAPLRIGGQFDATAYATNAYAMDILVSAVFPTQTITNDVWAKLVVVNENTLPVARGWSLGGIQRLYPQTDGAALIVEGDGSAVYFPVGLSPFTSPAGEFSQLIPSTLSGSNGWARLYADSTKVVFNSAGLMTQIRDRFNNMATVVYDASNRVVKIKDPLNLGDTLTYGAIGLATVKDPGGRITTITVDTAGRLTAVRDPDGVSTQYGYDSQKRLSTITDRAGATTIMAYDAQAGTVTSVTAPSVALYDGTSGSAVTSFSAWQKVGVPYTSTASLSFTPAVLSAVTASVTEPGGAVTAFTVNRLGAAVQVTDALGGVTTTTYDANGLPIKTLHASGAMDSTAYSSNGLPTFVQTADATNRRTIRYGGWGQPDSASGGPEPASRWFLGVNGRVDSVRTADSSMTRYVYDASGRVVSTTDPQGHLLAKRWFAGLNGNHSQDSVPGGYITTYYYDAFGRDTAVKGPASPLRRTHYDVLNRLIQSYDGVYPAPTSIAYDLAGHVTTATDPKGQTYGFAYNALGWLTRQTDPAGQSDTLKYNRDGDLMRRVNRRGQTLNYTYDALHRKTGKTGVNTDAASWTYAANGRVVTATSPITTETMYFNVRGQPDSTSTALATQTFWRRYHYSAIGLLDSLAVSGGGVAFRARKYTYDPKRLTVNGIRLGPSSAGSTQRVYDKDFFLTGTTYRGGDAVSWGYSGRNQLASISSTAPYGPTVTKMLNYDGEGRRLLQIDSTGAGGQAFTYDSLGRLTSDSTVVAPDPPPPPGDCQGSPPPIIGDNGSNCIASEAWSATSGAAFTYDTAGNRTDQGGTYGTGNRITTFAGCTYTSDLDGNVTSRACPGQTVTFKWTADANLDTVVVGGQTIAYYYDAGGRLVRKDVNGVAQGHFVWDGSNMLAELNGSATGEVAEYSYYGGMDDPHAIVVGGTEYNMHTDAIGNVVALTDSIQSLRRTYQYDAWGNLTGGIDGLPFNGLDRVRWKGALWVGSEASLYYMRHRWYEPQTGRFLNEDPLGIKTGMNQYAYAHDDPVNGGDATGLADCPKGYHLVSTKYDDEGNMVQTCKDGAGNTVTVTTDPLGNVTYGGSRSDAQTSGQDVGQRAVEACSAAVGEFFGTLILDGSFLVGVGEVYSLERSATLAVREGTSLAERRLYQTGGSSAFAGARGARAARDGVALGLVGEDLAALGLPAATGSTSPLAYFPFLDLIPAAQKASAACNPQ